MQEKELHVDPVPDSHSKISFASFLRKYKLTALVVIFVIVTGLILLLRIQLTAPMSTKVAGELNLIAFIGTITGAIMAASGIIVGLISVFSLLNMDQRTEQKFNQLALVYSEQQYARMHKMFRGFALQLESVREIDIERAQDRMQEAIDSYPQLEGARRQMGVRLFEATIDAFYIKTGFKTPDSLFKANAYDAGLNHGDGALNVFLHETSCKNYHRKESGSFEADAQKWLERSFEAGEDVDGLVSLYLAQLCGMTGRRKKMIENLKQAVGKRDCTSTNSWEASLYINSCENEADIKELGTWLNWQAPVTKNDLDKAMNATENHWLGKCSWLAMWKGNYGDAYSTKRVFVLEILIGSAEEQQNFQIRWKEPNSTVPGGYKTMPPLEDKTTYTFDEMWAAIERMSVLMMKL